MSDTNVEKMYFEDDSSATDGTVLESAASDTDSGGAKRSAPDDRRILALFLSRDESALALTQLKYGNYCHAVAMNVLRDRQDAEECFNDALLRVWNSIPPEKPHSLRTFIGAVTRHLAFDRYKAKTRDKRGGGAVPLPLDEIGEVVSDLPDVESEYLQKELAQYIRRFLLTLPRRDRNIFVSRYYFFCSTGQIAAQYDLNEAYVRTILQRTRNKLKKYLAENYFM